MNCNCANLQSVYDGKTVAGINELAGLSKAEINSKTWTTVYKCMECGQEWEEKYEGRGHGEVPVVRKR